MLHWIHKPLSDLKKEPVLFSFNDYSHNPLRLSQLLFGETVRILSENHNSYFIEALEQPCFSTEEGWHPYQGWIAKEDTSPLLKTYSPNVAVNKSITTLIWNHQTIPLSYGTLLRAKLFDDYWEVTLPNDTKGRCAANDLSLIFNEGDSICKIQERIVLESKLFLGMPYLWGGRSTYSQNNSYTASVDCSGFISLLYRAQGIQIPRDTKDQYRYANKMDSSSIQEGDLIYLQRVDHSGITHVVIYLGDGFYMHAPQSGEYVNILKWGDTIYTKENLLYIYGRPKPYYPHFASFLRK